MIVFLTPAIRVAIGVMSLAVCLCTFGQVPSDYGKSRGIISRNSVNGTLTFFDMFEDYNWEQASAKNYLPKNLDRYTTIVWMPDSHTAPSTEITQHLKKWLKGKSGRTLIYVGRGYDSQFDYWNEAVKNSDGAQKKNALRLKGLARFPDQQEDFSWLASAYSNECEWFNIVDRSTLTWNKSFTSDFVAPLDQSPTLKWGKNVLAPNETTIEKPRTLLELDGQPFMFEYVYNVYSSTYSYGYSDDSRCIVINNGSMLLNYPLVHDVNREFAQELVERTNFGSVLFVESGPFGPAISNGGYEGTWKWISIQPICYIAPQVMAIGVLILFAFFPILGNPRQGIVPSRKSYANHIEAIGLLLEKSADSGKAQSIVRDYFRLTGRNKNSSNLQEP
ncbi:MAG: hypothetical protein R3C03_09740 [Pirellulaceae bacterium]